MMDMSKINRAFGRIEGVSMGIEGGVRQLLLESVEWIEEELCFNGCATTHSTEGKPARKETGFVVAHPEMDELTRALWGHHEDYGKGYVQDFGAVCSDCRKAADLIVELRQELERVLFEKYAEG